MSKLWVKLLLLLVLLMVAIGVGLRFAAQALLASDEFNEATSRLVERAIRPFLPTAIVHLRGIGLTGLVDVRIEELTIRSTKRPDVTLAFHGIRVEPELLTLLLPGPTKFMANASLDGNGSFELQGTLRAKSLFGERPGGDAELLGTLRQANAVVFSDIFFAEETAPSFKLASGTLSGAFSYLKPFGSEQAAGKKLGNISIKLAQPIWELSGDKTRTVALKDISVDAELLDFSVEAKTPVIFADEQGTASVTGAVKLPKYADSGMSWDLEVRSSGGTDLPTTLGKLLRCKKLPATPQFKVSGPIASANCVEVGT